MIYNDHEISVNSYIIPKTLKIDVFGKNIIYAYLLVKLLIGCKKKICLLMNELVNSTTYHALLGHFSLLVIRKHRDNAGKNYLVWYDLPVLSLLREVIGGCVRKEGRGKEEEWRGSRTPQDRNDWRGSGGDTPYIFLKTIPFLKQSLYTFPISFPIHSIFIPIYPDKY